MGKEEMAKTASVHASVHIGESNSIPGFGIGVDIKVSGIDEELLKAAHEVSDRWVGFSAYAYYTTF